MRSTLTLKNITQEMLNKSYECRATKVDVMSAYNHSIGSHDLHSKIVTDHEARHERRGTANAWGNHSIQYYPNDTLRACLLNNPCTDKMVLKLLPLKSE